MSTSAPPRATQETGLSELPPTQRYYRDAVGHWRGPMNATVTDRRALFKAVGFFDGMSMLLMAIWPRWLGRMMLETTVAFHPAIEVPEAC